MHNRILAIVVVGALAIVANATAYPGIARADFGIDRFGAAFRAPSEFDADPGVEDNRAGAHSDFVTDFRLHSDLGPAYASEDPKDFTFELPAGALGDPSSTPACTQDALRAFACGAETQVGAARVDFLAILGSGSGSNDPPPIGSVAPVFNMERRNRDEVARLAFVVPDTGGATVNIIIQPRTEGDFGLEAKVLNAPRTYQTYQTRLVLWGVPSDPAHDDQRYYPEAGSRNPDRRPNPGFRRVGFMSAPTRCDGPLTTKMSATSYTHPDMPVFRSFSSPTLTGCEDLPFDPTIDVGPRDTRQADAPAGYDVSVSLPQTRGADERVTSHLRRAVVRLPPGLTLNPGVANGLTACEDGDLKIGKRDAATCPDASKLSGATVDVPILGGALTGNLVVRPQTAGETYRVAIVADGFGIHAKLPGVVRPDPTTGQLTAIFDEIPQVPFSKLRLSLDGGPRAPLANSASCENGPTSAEFTPWSGSGDVLRSSQPAFITFDGETTPCPSALPFSPRLSGGSRDSLSGRTSPFGVRVDRDDRNQEIRSLDISLPLGLTAIVKGVPLCPSEAAAAGRCDRSSRIGSVTAAAGAGSDPFYVRGSAYLTTGYRGAPYGMSFVIPVIAGPLDLGDVLVRARVEVDPVTTQLRVISDQLPRIVQGVPLRLRQVRVDIDRPRFTLTPTNCRRQALGAFLTAFNGAQSVTRGFYQASGCSRQSYKPEIALRLRGKDQTTDGKHPALAAVVKQRRGSSNISSVSAVLPSSLALDPNNARALCPYEQGQQVRCPTTSIVGRAKISTPLLNHPLRGPVYFVENVRRNRSGRLIKTLPTLLVTLKGEISLNVRASTSVRSGKNLVTTFRGLPDQPFSRFDLFINGGGSGILAANSSLCRAAEVARFETNAQGGRQFDDDVRLSVPCRD